MNSDAVQFLVIALAGLVGGCTRTAGDDVEVIELDVQESNGCGDVLVYKANPEGTRVIVVDADKSALSLGVDEKLFSIEEVKAGLRIWVDAYSRRPSVSPYCNDYMAFEEDLSSERWPAVSGRVSLTLQFSNDLSDGRYRAIVKLYDVVFLTPGRKRVVQRSPVTIVAIVGWHPG